MNYWWIGAGVLCLFTALLHLIAGGRDVVRPLTAATMDETARGTLYACWHLVTAALFLSAMALLGLGLRPAYPGAQLLALGISLLFVAFALVFLCITWSRDWRPRLFKLPQWLLLLPVGLLALWGALNG